MEILITDFPVFFLIFVRLTTFFLTVPLFSYRNIPIASKLALALVLSFVVGFAIDRPDLATDGTFVLLVIKEAIVGLGLGLLATMMLYAVQVAGGFIDLQMGFAIANVIDPQTGVQSPLLGQYFYIFALLFLLAVDGHHLIIDGIYHSYQLIAVDALFLPFASGAVAKHVVLSFVQMFITAFQMSIPVVASLFLVDVALGIIARTVPQVNVFVVGLPLKIFISFFALLISFSVLFVMIDHLFEEMFDAMRTLIRLTGGV